MSRLDELTQLALEGILDSRGEAELQGLLDSCPGAWTRYRQLLDVEAALRGLDQRFDVSEAVMERLAAERPRLALLPRPPGGASEDRSGLAPFVGAEAAWETWLARLAAPVTLAAGVVIAFALLGRVEEPERPGLARVAGEVEVVQEGGARSPAAGQALERRDRLVVAAGSAGGLEYSDKTSLSLAPRTEVVVAPDFHLPLAGKRSKRLELVSGAVAAEVAAQPAGAPLVVRTPHAYAIVRGTRFALAADESGTRLEVTEGRVDFLRAGEGSEAVSVEAGMWAEASAEGRGVPRLRPRRAEEGLLALYTFAEGGGGLVRDLSARGDPLDLALGGSDPRPLDWQPEGGLKVGERGFLASREPAAKIVDACRASGELTLEAWIEPAASVNEGPARVVTLSRASERLNFLLGQGGSTGDPEQRYTVRLFLRPSAGSGESSAREWQTPPGTASGGLAHLVLTRSRDGREALHLNGELVETKEAPGDFSAWHEDLRLALGNDPGRENRRWSGTYHLVAIYGRALDDEEVRRNHASGPRAPSFSGE